MAYRTRIADDASPWDTIQRLAHEVNWWLTEPEPGVVAIVQPTPRVSAPTQGRLMAATPVAPRERRPRCVRSTSSAYVSQRVSGSWT
jgi:hypothetical protein